MQNEVFTFLENECSFPFSILEDRSQQNRNDDIHHFEGNVERYTKSPYIEKIQYRRGENWKWEGFYLWINPIRSSQFFSKFVSFLESIGESPEEIKKIKKEFDEKGEFVYDGLIQALLKNVGDEIILDVANKMNA